MSDDHSAAGTPINTAAMTAFGREHDDVAPASRKKVISWAMWDYAAGYNLADGDWGNRTIRPDVLEALGLAD